MKCLALMDPSLWEQQTFQECPHEVCLVHSQTEFLHELASGQYFLIVAQYERIGKEIAQALVDRPHHCILYIVSQTLDFDTFRQICQFKGNEILAQADLLRHPDLLCRLAEENCNRFYTLIFSYLHQALHSTNREMTDALRPMLITWKGSRWAGCVVSLHGADSEAATTVEHILKSKEYLSISLPEKKEFFFVLPLESHQTEAETDKLEQLYAELCSATDNQVCIGVSQPLLPGDTLMKKLEEARVALQMRFYHDQSICFFHSRFFGKQNDYVQLVGLEKQITNALLSGFAQSEFDKLIDAYFAYFRDLHMLPSLVSDTVFRFLNSLDRMFKYIDPMCTLNLDLIQMEDIENLPTLEMMQQEIRRVLTRFLVTGSNYQNPSGISIDNVKHYLQENLSEALSLDQIAQTFHVNKFMLCKLFKQKTGVNLWEYFTTLRIEQAAKLLTGTDQKIAVIANAVGYADSGYFSTVFKHAYGISPKEYRAKHQKNV